MKRQIIAGITTGIMLFGTVSLVHADIIALSMTGTGGLLGWEDHTVGWEFTTSEQIGITALGIWDYGTTAHLYDDHQVGIFDTSGNLLTSVEVSDNTVVGNTYIDSFWYHSISTYILDTGTYIIGAYMPTRYDYISYYNSFSTSPEVTFNRNLYFNGGFSAPNVHYQQLGNGFFGPNFQYTTDPVPEPATMLLFGAGLVGLAGSIIRKQRR